MRLIKEQQSPVSANELVACEQLSQRDFGCVWHHHPEHEIFFLCAPWPVRPDKFEHKRMQQRQQRARGALIALPHPRNTDVGIPILSIHGS